MKTWIVAGIFVGLLILAGIAVVNATIDNSNIEEPVSTLECSTCGNSCRAQNNCGLSGCGATKRRTCGCGR